MILFRLSKVNIVFLWLCIFFVTLLPACQSKAGSSSAPDFELLNLQGNMVSLADYKGKVVLLNFFATYCPPCRMEIPDFVKLQDKYAKEGFVVIGISVDQNAESVLPDFIARLGINYPILLATQKVLKDYGDIYALPSTFIIDRGQNIVKQFTGLVSSTDVEPLIKKALEEKSS